MNSNNNKEKAKWEPPIIKPLNFKLTCDGTDDDWIEDFVEAGINETPDS